MLQILIPVQKYREMRIRYMETKTQQRALHEKVARLKNKNAPLHAQLKRVLNIDVPSFLLKVLCHNI
jgi:structural maintenance of chromosomes protein 5